MENKYFNMHDEGHFYELHNKPEGVQDLKFYKLAEDGSVEQEGTTCEAVLAVLVDRLTILNTQFHSSFNDEAILNIQSAIGQLEARTADRIERGVEGKHEV